MKVTRKVVYFGLSHCARIEQSRYHQLNDDIQKDNSFIYTHMFDFTFQIGLMTKKKTKDIIYLIKTIALQTTAIKQKKIIIDSFFCFHFKCTIESSLFIKWH